MIATHWQPLETLERRHILRVIREQEGNLSRAAVVLGIDRRTLYRRLASYQPRHAAIRMYRGVIELDEAPRK